LLTLTVFNKLYVDTYSVTGHELNEPFGALLSVQERCTLKPGVGHSSGVPASYRARHGLGWTSKKGRCPDGQRP
jgi:hypothetical protein